MKYDPKSILVPALFLALSQILSVLIGFNQGLMLLTALFLSVGYLAYQEVIGKTEAVLGTSIFFISTVVASIIGRLMSYERLCSGGSDLGGSLCEGYFEWWKIFFITDLSVNWPYWILFIAISIVAVAVYRKYRR